MQRNKVILHLTLIASFYSATAHAEQIVSNARVKEAMGQIQTQAKIARQHRDFDNPLYTGKWLMYPPTDSPNTLALAKNKYQPQARQAWGWWYLLLTSDFLPLYEQLSINAIEGGSKEDDLITVIYEVPEAYIQIVDGRTITITLLLKDRFKYKKPIFEAREPVFDWLSEPRKKRKLVPLSAPEAVEPAVSNFLDKEARENYVHAVFRRVFRFDYRQENDVVFSKVETRNSSLQGGTYGVLLTNRNGAGWFINGTITWWTNGDAIVFDVAKVKQPPVSKAPYKNNNYVFGLPINDKRRFDRFSATSSIDYDQVLKAALNDDRLTKYMPVPKVSEDIIHSRPVNRLIQTPE